MTEQTPIAFNAYTATLESGINLIEASAGTGKTYSIASLVLRFIVEESMPIEQLLVVTYTKAATKELKDRIRLRLSEAKNALSKVGGSSEENKDTDPGLLSWIETVEDKNQAQQRLILALADIDRANIFTIHSFCQRMLAQFALETGQLFDSELVDSIDNIKLNIAEDYWRQQTYERDQTQVVLLRSCAATPQALMTQIADIRLNSKILPENIDLETTLNGLGELISVLPRSLKNNVLTPLLEAFGNDPKKFNKAFSTSFESNLQVIQTWLADQNTGLPLDALIAFSPDALIKSLNIRKTKAATAEERKQDFLQQTGYNGESLGELANNLAKIKIAFPLGLYNRIREQLDQRLIQDNVLSFDDLISRLAQALEGDKGERLAEVLRERFKVALIDEFQDTDKQQWHIFSSLFSPFCSSRLTESKHYLYLIGDPKQAIYKFRGADIYSYLGAQKEASRHYNLGTNFRSQQNLISATNALFGVDESPFLIKEIAYHPVKAHRKDHYLKQDKQALEKLVMWQLADPVDAKHWTGKKARDQIQRHVVNEIVRLLNAQPAINIDEARGSQPLLPKDIAILVRSHAQAAEYQQLLSLHGVPSVLNSKQSVFLSEQAIELYHLLTAILRPTNTSLVKYALTLSWFGFNGQDFYQLQLQEDGLDSWQMDFQRYHELWQDKGLIAMMQQLMQEKQVIQHLAHHAGVERSLTNINHILELIQQQVQEQRLGLTKSIDWLQASIQQQSRTEGQELRLESDEDAVKIVTIHSSKGLEYPIVFCPDLWLSTALRNKSLAVCYKDDKTITDMGSPKLEQHLEMALNEQRAEDLRLMYVAVTRAKYRCYLAWADERTATRENNSPMAYLLKQQQGETWTERLESLVDKDTDAFEYDVLELDTAMTDSYKLIQKKDELQLSHLTRSLSYDWSMSSYSSLAYYSIHDSVHKNVHESEQPELPQDKSEEPEIPSTDITEPNEQSEKREAGDEGEELVELPRGAHTGNVVHELLENISFQELAKGGEPTKEYEEWREKLCLRYGLEIDEEQQGLLISLLEKTVNTCLSADDTDFYLSALDERQCLKEMAFYFETRQLDTLKINQVLKDSPAYQTMSSKQMKGQLTGFIDLICEYQGLYYVMDYKTNALAQYDNKSMTKAMREHNYGLQYWLYSLVLHEYLQQRLPDYDFATHFGGVRYLFVRGMEPDVPMSGVFEDSPKLETLNALSAAFQGETL